MSNFSAIEKPLEPLKPVHTRVVPPSVFASTWTGRPREEVCAGFRALSEEDTAYARSEAAKRAWELHPRIEDDDNRWDAFNDVVMRLSVARGTCDPNDASKAWDLWRGLGDVNVHLVLTRDGTRFLYDEVERASILTIPLRGEASDEDLLALFDALPLALPNMDSAQAARARRMLAYVLDEVTPFLKPHA